MRFNQKGWLSREPIIFGALEVLVARDHTSKGEFVPKASAEWLASPRPCDMASDENRDSAKKVLKVFAPFKFNERMKMIADILETLNRDIKLLSTLANRRIDEETIFRRQQAILPACRFRFQD